jgi:hypothetical protein
MFQGVSLPNICQSLLLVMWARLKLSSVNRYHAYTNQLLDGILKIFWVLLKKSALNGVAVLTDFKTDRESIMGKRSMPCFGD